MTNLKIGSRDTFAISETLVRPGMLNVELVSGSHGVLVTSSPYEAMAMASALLAEAGLCLSHESGKDECEALANLCDAVLRRLPKEQSP
jgi:hypothetical protein